MKKSKLTPLFFMRKLSNQNNLLNFLLIKKHIPSKGASTMDFLNHLKNAMPEKNTGKVYFGISRAIDNIKGAIVSSSEIPKSQQENFIHDMDRICSELKLWLKSIEIKGTH